MLTCFVFMFRVFLGINLSNGTKVAKSRGHTVRSGVHEVVLSLVKEMALFTGLTN